MKILFVRHGQTDWNLENKLQGRTNIKLNSKGIEQANITKELLKNEKIDLIICSTLDRAKQTANIININNIPIIYDDRIVERNCGEFEGKLITELNYDDFWNYNKNIKYLEAEAMHDFFKRIYSVLDEYKEKYKDKNILIVSHGGVSIPFKCYFEGIPNVDTLKEYIVDNCAVLKYNI